jgi:hypothetical protein
VLSRAVSTSHKIIRTEIIVRCGRAGSARGAGADAKRAISCGCFAPKTYSDSHLGCRSSPALSAARPSELDDAAVSRCRPLAFRSRETRSTSSSSPGMHVLPGRTHWFQCPEPRAAQLEIDRPRAWWIAQLESPSSESVLEFLSQPPEVAWLDECCEPVLQRPPVVIDHSTAEWPAGACSTGMLQIRRSPLRRHTSSSVTFP